jgi:hypothetical protein
MKELKFASFESAMSYLANVTQKKVLVAEDNEVENPRENPKNKAQEKT